jgi:hypothetical protein
VFTAQLRFIQRRTRHERKETSGPRRGRIRQGGFAHVLRGTSDGTGVTDPAIGAQPGSRLRGRVKGRWIALACLPALLLAGYLVPVTFAQVQQVRATGLRQSIAAAALPRPLSVDPTLVNCHGVGDLCATTDQSPGEAITSVKEALSSKGVTVGAVNCRPQEVDSPLAEVDNVECAAASRGVFVLVSVEASSLSRNSFGGVPFALGYTWVRVTAVSRSDDAPSLELPTHRPTGATETVDVLSLLDQGLIPPAWPTRGQCTDTRGTTCMQYFGVAQPPPELDAKDAAALLVQRIRATGQAVDEAGCREISDGVDQCVVAGAAGTLPATFLALVRTGGGAPRVTFEIRAN